MARRIPPPKGTFKFPGTIEQYLEAAEFWWEEKGDYKGFKEEFGVFDKDGEWFQVRKGRDSKTKKPKPVLVNQEGVEAFTMKRRMNEELPYYIEKQLKDLEKKGLLPEGASLKDFKKRISSGFNAMRKAKLEHFKKTGEYLDIGHWAPVGSEVSNVDWNTGRRPPNVPGQTRLESRILNRGGGNSIHKVPTRDALVNMGIPRDWNEALAMYKDPTGNPSPLFDNLEDLENFASKSRDLVDNPDLTARQQLDDTISDLPSSKVKPSELASVDPISGLVKPPGVLKTVTGTVMTAAGFTPSVNAAEQLKAGNYKEAGKTYLQEQLLGEAIGAGSKKVLSSKLAVNLGKKLLTMGGKKLATSLGGKAAASIAGGPAAPIIMGGLLAKDLYDVTNVLTDGALEPKQIRGRSGAKRAKMKAHIIKQSELMLEMRAQERKNKEFETGGR